MPRFLNTHTGAFEWHDDPSKIRYAILSHKWQSPENGGEQSYQRVCELQADAKMRQIDVLAHPDLSDKIRRFCDVAREDGFRLGWLDSCCIDKSSSTELSEAINSMYDLYGRSNICYAYLADVPEEGSDDADRKWHFARDLLHTRGWTLQELIAPTRLTFLARTWKPVGTKSDWAGTLEKITKIPVEVLTGQMPVDSTSVAQRMSWAANRQTTRVEDRAYSLLGIFGIHMSPMYGEGTNAFLRLQEKIIKKIPDQRVFAWGVSCELRFSLNSPGVLETVPDVDGGFSGDSYTHGYGLLAPNPQFFDNDVVTRPPQSLVDFKRHLGDAATSLPSLHCSFTPEGSRIQFLCIPLADRHSLAFTSSPSTQKVQSAHALALLQCMDSHGRLVALPLCAPFTGKRNLRGLTLGTITPIEDDATTALISDQFRFVRLAPETVKQALQGGSLVPQEVTLLRHFPVPTVRKQLGSLGDWYTCGIVSRFPEPMRPSVFAISSECTAALKALGFTTSALDCRYSEREFRLRVVIDPPLSPPHGRARIPVTIVLALPERALSPRIQVSFITTHEFSTTGLNNGRKHISVHLVDASMPPSPVAAKGFVICEPCDTTCENQRKDTVPARRMTLSIELSQPASDLNGAKQILVSIMFSEPSHHSPPPPLPAPTPPPPLSRPEAPALPTVCAADEENVGERGASGHDKTSPSIESSKSVPDANKVAAAADGDILAKTPSNAVVYVGTPATPATTSTIHKSTDGIATSHSFSPRVLSPAGTNRTVSTPISDTEDVLTPVMRRLPSATRGIKRDCDAIAQQVRRLSLELAPGSHEHVFPLPSVVSWGSLCKEVQKIYDILKRSCESAREAHATLNMYHAGIFSQPKNIVEFYIRSHIKIEVTRVLQHIDRHVYEAFDVVRSTNALVDGDLQKFESATKRVLDAHIDGVSHEIQTVKKRRVEALYRTEQREGQLRQMGVNIHPALQVLGISTQHDGTRNRAEQRQSDKKLDRISEKLDMKRQSLRSFRDNATLLLHDLRTEMEGMSSLWRCLAVDLQQLHAHLDLADWPNPGPAQFFSPKMHDQMPREAYDALMKTLEEYIQIVEDNLPARDDTRSDEE